MHVSSDIRSLDITILEKILLKENFEKYRATQVFDWLIKGNIYSFSEMNNLPKDLISFLKSRFKINNICIKLIQSSNDGTIKFLLSLYDNNIIEAVLIPTENRITACISSQVGCSLDCDFCATSKIKRMRNLEFYEIFDQLMILNFESIKLFKRSISNVVFMGMGEPLLNYKNVLKAIEMISSKKGIGISKKKITVSTSGISKIIKLLADENSGFKLAVSLHSAIETTRNEIMPFSKDFPLSDLMDSLNYWYKKTKSKITIEYLVWSAINDNMNHINSLVEFCKRVPSKVNLIEFNDIGNLKFKSSETKWIQKYIKILKLNNISVSVRRSRGKDIDAACGQLANKI
tara:strand:+ start:2273 stop:3310 length:1038 start_codon:yes stop_codon:yes gene_type:complete